MTTLICIHVGSSPFQNQPRICCSCDLMTVYAVCAFRCLFPLPAKVAASHQSPRQLISQNLPAPQCRHALTVLYLQASVLVVLVYLPACAASVAVLLPIVTLWVAPQMEWLWKQPPQSSFDILDHDRLTQRTQRIRNESCFHLASNGPLKRLFDATQGERERTADKLCQWDANPCSTVGGKKPKEVGYGKRTRVCVCAHARTHSSLNMCFIAEALQCGLMSLYLPQSDLLNSAASATWHTNWIKPIIQSLSFYLHLF